MKVLIRLIALTVIIFLGAQTALETCVHASSETYTSAPTHHSPNSATQNASHDCVCSIMCNVTLKMNSFNIAVMTADLIQYFETSYPEQHYSSNAFHSLIIKPPIA